MRQKIVLLGVGICLCLALGSIFAAESRAPTSGYSVPWWTVDGGGGESSGGALRVSGTVGQPDAGGGVGGVYKVQGGFWNSTMTAPYGVYLPLVLR